MTAGRHHRGPVKAGPPLLPLRSTGRQPRIERKGAAQRPLGLTHQEDIDMTSQSNRSISKAPAAPVWTKPAMKSTAFVLAGQVAQYGPHSIRRDLTIRHRSNRVRISPVTDRRNDHAACAHIRHPASKQGLPAIRDLAAWNIRNNSQPNLLPPNGMAGTPADPFAVDRGLHGRRHGGRWHCALALRVFRTG